MPVCSSVAFLSLVHRCSVRLPLLCSSVAGPLLVCSSRCCCPVAVLSLVYRWSTAGLSARVRGRSSISSVAGLSARVGVADASLMCRWSVSALSLFCRYSARVMAASPSARVMVAVTGLSLVHRCSVTGLSLVHRCHWSVAGSSLLCHWSVAGSSLLCHWSVAGSSLLCSGHSRWSWSLIVRHCSACSSFCWSVTAVTDLSARAMVTDPSVVCRSFAPRPSDRPSLLVCPLLRLLVCLLARKNKQTNKMLTENLQACFSLKGPHPSPVRLS